jgi:CheY-like chemotaxis protein
LGRVLVVDDDGSILKLLQVTFEMEGHQVLVADCGERALQVAADESPDVIVCDLMMPRMSGLSVLEQLRSRPKTKEIPFVLVTGSGRRGDAERAMELGANGYVIKPFDPFDLIKTVEKVLRD